MFDPLAFGIALIGGIAVLLIVVGLGSILFNFRLIIPKNDG